MRASGGSPEWLARQRRKVEGGLAEMARLVGQRQWAVGEAFSLGDIAVGTAVGYLSMRFQDLPGARCTRTWPCSVTGWRSGHRSKNRCLWRRRFWTRWCEGCWRPMLVGVNQCCYYYNSLICIFHDGYRHFLCVSVRESGVLRIV